MTAQAQPAKTVHCIKHGKQCSTCKGTGIDPKGKAAGIPIRCKECNGMMHLPVPWEGHVICSACTRIHVGELQDGKYVYPSAVFEDAKGKLDGFCPCGVALLPSAAIAKNVFSGRAMCPECVKEKNLAAVLPGAETEQA